MRNVGIIRRLDALGRIVIPREYRKMHRIELGDPLEIIAQDNGEIVLRKVDLTAELMGQGQTAADAAARQLGKTVLVCSPRAYVCGSGSGRNALIGQDLPNPVLKAIAARKETSLAADELGIEAADAAFAAVCPIYGDMDCFGAMMLFSSAPILEEELRILRVLATMTGANLQKY